MPEQKIKITKNGPYIVSGNIPLGKERTILDKDKIPCNWKKTSGFPEQESYSLSRCGNSSNKPFCDGEHIPCKFNDGDESIN